jgi:ribosomal protein S18 acetylase RimI-like enzyme
MLIEPATIADYDAVRAVDHTLPGVPDRVQALHDWIARGECLVARLADAASPIGGFIVANDSFFAQRFIVLLVVHPDHRRRGIASALVRRVAETSPTAKLFTSTNRSNTAMQSLCESLGFVRSGIVENLDDDDPELIYFKRIR